VDTHGNDSANPARKRSVEHLQNLYGVLVGLALALAVANVLTSAIGEDAVRWRSMPLFFAFLVTVVPFYHGALRHLDDVYVGSGLPHPRSGAVLVDFFVLFLEGCVFLGLATSLDQPERFAWTYLVLLSVDIAWAALTSTVLSHERHLASVLTWLKVNSVAVATLLLLLGLIYASGFDEHDLLLVVLPIFAAARSAVDYALEWRFYAAL
jgi:hypothetical protein